MVSQDMISQDLENDYDYDFDNASVISHGLCLFIDSLLFLMNKKRSVIIECAYENYNYEKCIENIKKYSNIYDIDYNILYKQYNVNISELDDDILNDIRMYLEPKKKSPVKAIKYARVKWYKK